VKPKPVKIRAGLYSIRGVWHRCGGELRAESCGRPGEFRWELWCKACRACDPDGYRTLRECVANAPGFARGRATS
jgi:hypothetical protein